MLNKAPRPCFEEADPAAVYALLHYPGMRTGWVWAVYLAGFIVLVALYAIAGSLLGRLGSPSARWIGLLGGAPAVLCGWWAADSNSVLSAATVIFVALPGSIAAIYIARGRRRADDAMVATGCASLTGGLLMFIAYVSTTYITNGGPTTPVLLQEFARSGASNYQSWAITDNLAGAVLLLLLVPLLTAALGSVAARIATPKSPAEAPTRS